MTEKRVRRMRRRRVRRMRRRRVRRKKTRTWRRIKLRKDKEVDGGRRGIADFMAAKPLPSLPWDHCEPSGTTA